MPPVGIKTLKVLSANKIARQKSTPVEGLENPSAQLKVVCWQMIKTCLTSDGIGLAAPQVGIFKKLFVIKESEGLFRVCFNPSYTTPVDSTQEIDKEGCLSVPGKVIRVSRPTRVEATWTEVDFKGGKKEMKEVLTGWKARVFVHEHDHLLGVSILDK